MQPSATVRRYFATALNLICPGAGLVFQRRASGYVVMPGVMVAVTVVAIQGPDWRWLPAYGAAGLATALASWSPARRRGRHQPRQSRSR